DKYQWEKMPNVLESTSSSSALGSSSVQRPRTGSESVAESSSAAGPSFMTSTWQRHTTENTVEKTDIMPLLDAKGANQVAFIGPRLN
ncbi:hypothetical protein EDD11_009701, partial [Mortierella claussenii]